MSSSNSPTTTTNVVAFVDFDPLASQPTTPYSPRVPAQAPHYNYKSLDKNPNPASPLPLDSDSGTEPSTFLSLDFLSLPSEKTMPYCEVTSQKTSLNSQLNNGIKIFYRTYGRGPTKVLLIIGSLSLFSKILFPY